jgi:hypothetical protein
MRALLKYSTAINGRMEVAMKVTERGREAWSVTREPMDKNRIRGGAEQGEQA